MKRSIKLFSLAKNRFDRWARWNYKRTKSSSRIIWPVKRALRKYRWRTTWEGNRTRDGRLRSFLWHSRAYYNAPLALTIQPTKDCMRVRSDYLIWKPNCSLWKCLRHLVYPLSLRARVTFRTSCPSCWTSKLKSAKNWFTWSITIRPYLKTSGMAKSPTWASTCKTTRRTTEADAPSFKSTIAKLTILKHSDNWKGSKWEECIKWNQIGVMVPNFGTKT